MDSQNQEFSSAEISSLASTTQSRLRKWTELENELFAKTVVDPQYLFGVNLERLAMKRSSNQEVMLKLGVIFRQRLDEAEFKTKNEYLNFTSRDGVVSAYTNVVVSAHKLRKKYSNMKAEWRKYKSSKQQRNLPAWFPHLNRLFTEQLAGIETTSSYAKYLSHENGEEASFKVEDHNKEDDSYHRYEDSVNYHQERRDLPTFADLPSSYNNESTTHTSNYDVIIQSNDSDTDSEKRIPIIAEVNERKYVQSPGYPVRRKRRCCSEEEQPSHPLLERLVENIENISAMETRRLRMTIEADTKREEMLLKHLAEESARTREHELKLAQIYANASDCKACSKVKVPSAELNHQDDENNLHSK